MYTKEKRPTWWLLYLFIPVMIGLFLVEIRLPLSGAGHRLMEFSILLIIFGGMWLWSIANNGAITFEELDKRESASRTDSGLITPDL